MVKKIYLDHIGIATSDLNESSVFWNLIGLIQGEEDEIVEDQGVKTRFFDTSKNNPSIKSPKIELLEPTSSDTPIGKFLDKRGPGIQQICFRVENLPEMISLLKNNGVLMIDEEPRIGAGGKHIAFVHPKSTGGVLVELTQYD
ncbi:MAG: methylmalonyl-CoA epimerase [Candidatus Poseidoniaceae archaeon]|nr:methylmalonyl-CoA epimerase [Euryarchaeota archaeon]MBL6890715.1 methylmalonyl-CoA epimerase [Candidatus Poseidoniaceae archaeon]RAH07579.1 MAG: methylmalonyl-CoA epimerase [Euryarchaeota archaeon TMED132]|tara:strand:+ start:4620 stop:5048 length:429 start_codon:yes stop_codon:yes gene_type:complete